MKQLFDYVFFRVYEFFCERGDNIPDTRGALVLAILQFFTVLDILVAIKTVYPFPLPESYFVIPIAIVLVMINSHRYENADIQKIKNKWQNENHARKIRNGWLIGIYLLVSILFPILTGSTM